MRRLLAAVIMALVLTGCTIDLNEANVVPGNERERRIMQRHDQAEGVAASMVLALVVLVPMGLVTLLIAVRRRSST